MEINMHQMKQRDQFNQSSKDAMMRKTKKELDLRGNVNVSAFIKDHRQNELTLPVIQNDKTGPIRAP